MESAVTQLESDVRARLEHLVAAADRELGDLKHARTELDELITSLEAKRRAWATALAVTNDDELVRHAMDQVSRTPTKRQAVLALLDETPRRPMPLVDIRRELIRRGWMTDSRRSHHALEVAVRAMEDRGEIVRPARGIYGAVSATQDDRLVA